MTNNTKIISTPTPLELTLTFNAQLLEYETWHVDPADQGKFSEKKAYTTNAFTHTQTHTTHTGHTLTHTTHTQTTKCR